MGMLLLRFVFENHKSFRDAAELSMVHPRLRTQSPPEGAWIDYTTRVAAIYGANASGKSGVLDALRYARACIDRSATAWAGRRELPRAQFALDSDSRKRDSRFTFEFVLDAVRYEYGFAVSTKSVEEEWLHSFPAGRQRVLYQRLPGNKLEFGRTFGAGGPMLAKVIGDRELVLSKGAVLKHPVLAEIQENLVSRIEIAEFDDSARQARLRSVIKDVADGSFDMDDLRTMLRVADVGIAGAEVLEEDVDPKMLKMFRALVEAQRTQVHEGEGDSDADGLESELDDEDIERMFADLARTLMFNHIGMNEKTYALRSADQSTGTLTWLSLAAPAIKAVREGGVLAVDELDASLHPQLAQVMIQMFRDPLINTTGAQLVFTTHDTYFLSPTSDVRLTPDEVWFVEKQRDGGSDLFRLSEFPTRDDQNFSRRYLQGRYGAVPSVAPSFLANLVRRTVPVDRKLV